MSGDSHRAALDFLTSRIDYERMAAVPYGERQFKLDRMRELLARLANPERELAIVHVTGTKGKGSTSAMIAGALTAAGLHSGLFTSPHLERVEERIRIDGLPIDAEELAVLVQQVRPVAADMDAEAAADPARGRPTYFELVTAMALAHFRASRVDAAVLEVGMGGRLDSTNVCLPRVSVITSISLDHTRQLGETLAEIAREKAGIIKPGVPVVSGVTEREPADQIAAAAARRGSRLIQRGRDFDFEYYPPRAADESPVSGSIDFRFGGTGTQDTAGGGGGLWPEVQVGLLGRHQGANAAVALATLMELRNQGWNVPEAACRRGLAELAWPARVEVVGRRPTVVVDAAHNVASAAALAEVLEESFRARRRTLVFATTREKDAAGMLRLLAPKFDRIVLTRYTSNPRGVPPEELAGLLPLGHPPLVVAADVAAAWEEVRRHVDPADLVCVTGSFFIAAEMRGEIAGRPAASPLMAPA
jgi:dihydrofolate synthase/folylpolyglutamate synthase